MGELKKGVKISKNFVTDQVITDVNDIVKIAENKGSIYVAYWKRTSPAAFILGMQFMLVLKWTNNNQFYKIKKI